MHKKVAVAVLGGTGLVGQRLIHLLADHPWFELIEIGASERSSGKSYRDAVAWKLPTPIPAAAALLPVKRVDPTAVTAPVVFSALDGAVADEVEVPFAKAGRAVISNARSHRMDPDVPLLVPEVNPSHLGVLVAQRERFGGGGLIVTNPNCSVIGLCLALAPLMRERRLLQLVVTTLQAASGAGYPGVPALDLIDNVIPYIGGEEEKLEIEPQKIFGTIQGGRIVSSATAVSAHVHRVPVSDGHTLAVSAAFDPPISPTQAVDAMRAFQAEPQRRALPSAPDPAIVVLSDLDRPQPRLDRMAGGGMAVVVSKVRVCPVLGLKFEVLSHNTVRGAAGGTLLIAEMLQAEGLLP
ncbi:MAG: aspartate-semialdehyde dehydrogenase [Acidobacteriota bacterium]